LTEEDLSDLALLRLDMMVALTVNENGHPGLIYSAHLLPDNREKKGWEVDPPVPLGQWDIDFLQWIQSLEDEFQRGQRSITLKISQEKAILVSVGRENREALENSMEELKDLAESSGVFVADSLIQRPMQLSPTTLMGEGKLKELLVKCMQRGVDLIIFDQNLTPGQMATISDLTELRVIDRTQLILDIFAQRAHTQEGKVQVELAQLKYLLPRLAKKTLALSRLTGGIGGRGPGETKLEIDRRRVRGLRRKTRIPVLSIIGYTNAGKTTLFNVLTGSQFHVEEKLFATLDTATRRLRCRTLLPMGSKVREVVITDTVGLIRNLPKDLMVAFRPTFDELHESDVLIHLVDISNPRFPAQLEAVHQILVELELNLIPRLLVFNKEDRLDREKVEALCEKYGGVSISALRPETLGKFFLALERKLWEGGGSFKDSYNVRLTNEDSFDISNRNLRC
jgi:GTP-binding protein HflX